MTQNKKNGFEGRRFMRSDMDSWAKPIKTFDEIPDFFRISMDFLTVKDNFYSMIYLPSGFLGSRKTTPKLIFFMDDTVYVLEKTKKGVIRDHYSLTDIVYIETGNILLYSWLAISGLSGGAWKTSKIEYNSVNERYFRRVYEYNKVYNTRCGNGDR